MYETDCWQECLVPVRWVQIVQRAEVEAVAWREAIVRPDLSEEHLGQPVSSIACSVPSCPSRASAHRFEAVRQKGGRACWGQQGTLRRLEEVV